MRRRKSTFRRSRRSFRGRVRRGFRRSRGPRRMRAPRPGKIGYRL